MHVRSSGGLAGDRSAGDVICRGQMMDSEASVVSVGQIEGTYNKGELVCGVSYGDYSMHV